MRDTLTFTTQTLRPSLRPGLEQGVESSHMDILVQNLEGFSYSYSSWKLHT